VGTKKMLSWSVAGVLTAALVLAASVRVGHRKAQLANRPAPPSRPTAVFVKAGRWGSLAVTGHELGTVEPEAEAVLSAQRTGYATALQMDVGDPPRRGEAAAEMDTRLSEARRDALAAELAGARDDPAIKQGTRDRRRKLVRTGAVAQEPLDEFELAARLAESRVRRLEEDLSAATVSLSFSRLESPFDGVVTERMREVGDLVSTGTPVLRLEMPDRGTKILVQVPQGTAAALPPNAPARLTHGDQALETAVDRVHPAILSGNLATAEIKVPARPFGLPSRAVVGVDLTVAEPRGWIVDADCLLETGAETLAFPVNDDMSVAPVAVTVLGRAGSRAVVDGPLTAWTALAAGPESLLLTLGPGVRVLPVPGGAS